MHPYACLNKVRYRLDGRPAKRVVSQSRVETADVLTIQLGFLEEDDADTIQREREAVKGKGKKVSRVSCILFVLA